MLAWLTAPPHKPPNGHSLPRMWASSGLIDVASEPREDHYVSVDKYVIGFAPYSGRSRAQNER